MDDERANDEALGRLLRLLHARGYRFVTPTPTTHRRVLERAPRLSLDWARAAMDRLAPCGRLLFYTGAAIVAGADPLREALEAATAARGLALDYRELDVDVFGEELSRAPYADVDRIAAVGAVVSAP